MATIQTITKQQGINPRRSRIVIPGARFPNRASAKYRRSLDSMIGHMSSLINSEVMPMLANNQDEFITDSIISLKSEINSIISKIAGNFVNIGIFSADIANRNAHDVNQTHKHSFISNASRALGVDLNNALVDEGLGGIIDRHVKENVKLIKTIPEQYFDRVRDVVNGGMENGLSVSSIARQLFNQGKDAKTIGVLGITKRRAKIIARDQSGKLLGQINSARQQNLGITDYVWRDRGDSRVRPLHVEQNGQQYSWNGKPRPDEGLDPGQPILCRCIAEAVVVFD